MVVVVRAEMGRSRCVTRVMFQPRLLDLATCGRLLVINYNPDSGGFHLEYVGDCKELDICISPDSGGFHLEYVGDCKELDICIRRGSFDYA